MYNWRNMTSRQREETLLLRRQSRVPWHSPPHFQPDAPRFFHIHHNPVHHSCAERWQDWPCSSASDFLKDVGTTEALRLWKAYPVLDYGKGWDDAAMRVGEEAR